MVGKLTVNCGGMFSGKSTELLRQGERHILAGHDVIYVKPAVDTRYSKKNIVTHSGLDVKAKCITNVEELLAEDVMAAKIVLIDEVQFLGSIAVEHILQLVKLGKTVYCSGLDMDFNGIEFPIVAALLCRADVVNKLHAVCGSCGEDAVYSHLRSGSTGGNFKLGGKEEYIPLCRTCFMVSKHG